MARIDKSLLTLRPAEVTALAVLLVTAIVYVWVLNPAEDNLSRLERALAQRAAASPVMPANDGPKDAAAKLAAFYAFFDRNLTYNDWLARFYEIAERTGVQTSQAEYRRTRRADVPLALHEVSLPVSGDYGKVRAFVEGVLGTIPVASLDYISFRRRQPNEDPVDAELKFTFYIPASGAPQ
jgi:hypothetical protein